MKLKRYYRTEEYFVAPSNFADEVTQNLHLPNEVEIHDVTLRDGEQQANIAFTKDEKIRIAEALAEAGVHRIEAGMPAVSKSDEQAIAEIVKRNLNSKIFVFSRATPDDVKLAASLGVHGVVLEIPVNEELIKFGYEWPDDRAINAVIKASALAHELGLYVDLFLMDSSRLSPLAFVDKVKAIQNGGHVDAVTLVDTQGVLNTPAAKYMISYAVKHLNIPVETHFHNDLGLAVANTLAGLESGAKVLQTTVLGIGPRAGQAATEQVALAMRLLYGIECGLKEKSMYELGRLVGELSRFQYAANQPVVGDVLYTIESGMPATWWKRIRDKHPLALYGILPSTMGRDAVQVALGKMSGVASVQIWLEKMGYNISDADIQNEILLKVKEKSISVKRTLTPEEFTEIVTPYL